MVRFSPPLTTVPFFSYIQFQAQSLVTLGFCFDFWTYLLSKKTLSDRPFRFPAHFLTHAKIPFCWKNLPCNGA